jgi:hypothetical protein
MKKFLAVAGLAVAMPLSANAIVMTVEYSGHVSLVDEEAGDPFSYSVGDLVSGAFYYDTDLVSADVNIDPDIGDYRGPNDFVTGSGSTSHDNSYDLVYVADNSFGADALNIGEGGQSDVAVLGGIQRTTTFNSVLARASLVDFIAGGGILTEPLMLTSASGLDQFFGQYYIESLFIPSGGGSATLTQYGFVNFDLDRLAVYDASTRAVPEPATLSLLGAGLISFAALRRRRAQKV